MKLLDIVELTTDEHKPLKKGQRGTIVHVYTTPHRAFEVEFLDEDGQMLGLLPINPKNLKLVKAFEND